MISLEDQIRSHADLCREQIPVLTQKLSKFKPGHLGIYTSNGYERCKLLIPGHKPVNISKKADDVKEYYARKAFFEARVTDYEADLSLCDQILPSFDKHPHAMEKLLANTRLCSMISQKNPAVSPDDWANADYTKLEDYPEGRRIPTEANIYVRSKGEATIVTGLVEISASFRYEEEVTFGNIILHPDFSVLHPKTRKIILIEYFGMMDDEKYRKQTISKLNLYAGNGYFPQDNLICFYESKEEPLTIMKVRKTLQAALL